MKITSGASRGAAGAPGPPRRTDPADGQVVTEAVGTGTPSVATAVPSAEAGGCAGPGTSHRLAVGDCLDRTTAPPPVGTAPSW
jgi:outer membrane lipoprotein SlyB